MNGDGSVTMFAVFNQHISFGKGERRGWVWPINHDEVKSFEGAKIFWPSVGVKRVHKNEF